MVAEPVQLLSETRLDEAGPKAAAPGRSDRRAIHFLPGDPEALSALPRRNGPSDSNASCVDRQGVRLGRIGAGLMKFRGHGEPDLAGGG